MSGTIKLNNGTEMRQVGLGVFMIPDGDATYNSVLSALKAGYRKIDTAHAYQNERSVGKAIKDSGIPRSEIFLASKLWPSEYGEGKTAVAIDKMLERLGTEYLDLCYLHQPFGDVKGAWKDLEKAYAAKKIRNLGISDFDFSEKLFTDFVEGTTVKPQMLQIELHPYAQRLNIRELAKKYDIKVECWYPFGGRESKGVILKDPVIVKIAEAHKKSPVQVILRFDIQQGLAILPGSSNPAHIAANLDVFDFTLTADEVKAIEGLNKEQRFFTMTFEEAEKKLTAWAPAD